MDRASARLLAARLVGALAVLEAACLLGILIFVDIGWGVGFFGLLGLVYLAYFFILLLLGIGAVQANYGSRLGLSAVLVFQTCWTVAAFPLNSPLGLIIPTTLHCIAAWVVYPGLKPRPQTV